MKRFTIFLCSACRRLPPRLSYSSPNLCIRLAMQKAVAKARAAASPALSPHAAAASAACLSPSSCNHPASTATSTAGVGVPGERDVVRARGVAVGARSVWWCPELTRTSTYCGAGAAEGSGDDGSEGRGGRGREGTREWAEYGHAGSGDGLASREGLGRAVGKKFGRSCEDGDAAVPRQRGVAESGSDKERDRIRTQQRPRHVRSMGGGRGQVSLPLIFLRVVTDRYE